MDYANNVTAFYNAEHYQATEAEKARNALKFFIATAALRRLLADKQISKREFELSRADLARKYNQPII